MLARLLRGEEGVVEGEVGAERGETGHHLGRAAVRVEQETAARERVGAEQLVELAPGLQTVDRGGAVELNGECELGEEALDLLGQRCGRRTAGRKIIGACAFQNPAVDADFADGGARFGDQTGPQRFHPVRRAPGDVPGVQAVAGPDEGEARGERGDARPVGLGGAVDDHRTDVESVTLARDGVEVGCEPVVLEVVVGVAEHGAVAGAGRDHGGKCDASSAKKEGPQFLAGIPYARPPKAATWGGVGPGSALAPGGPYRNPWVNIRSAKPISHLPRALMKLQTRARLGVLILFAALILLIAGVSGHSFMRGLAAAERREAEEVAQRATRIVDAEIENLRRTARDYAEWNASVAYIAAPNVAYEEGNWTAETMGNVQVDLMMLFAPDGRLVGGAGIAATGDKAIPPNAAQVAAFAGDACRVAGCQTAGLRPAGLRLVEGHPVFFACLPVLPTGGGGTPCGALVAVRRIDERLRERIERIMGFAVALEPLAAADAPVLGRAVREGSAVRVVSLSDEHMSVTAPLRGTDDQPLLQLRIELDRVVYQEGLLARRLMFWQLLAAAVVVALLTAWLLRVHVIRRLENLCRDLRAIGERREARGRVRVDGSDEITDLANGLNAMIEAREQGDLEREHARKERELLQEQLMHAQKMEAVGEFAGGVAHDFNNCLTSIAGWLQLTKEELPEDNPAQENLVLALNSVEHATSVVRQLLTYSRHGSAPLGELQLGELLSESLVLLRSGLPRTIELRLHAEGVDDHVMADRTQLLQVLMNLLNNARDAMGNKGTLTISLGEVKLPSAEAAPANHLPPGDYVRLSVQDTGPGIPPDHLARIFKPFFTTKPAGKGTGLGLAVVQSVVARHNGTVWVESQPGAGATFHVLLPHRAANDVAAAGVRGLRVLMAEDDPAVARVLTTALKRRGCEIVAAEDGAAAWEALVLAERPFDVVLTDLTMPRLSGMQLAEKVFDSGRKVPVVLMTAYGSTLDAEQVKQAGFAAVLSKPLVHDQVVATLAQVVGRVPVVSPKR